MSPAYKDTKICGGASLTSDKKLPRTWKLSPTSSTTSGSRSLLSPKAPLTGDPTTPTSPIRFGFGWFGFVWFRSVSFRFGSVRSEHVYVFLDEKEPLELDETTYLTMPYQPITESTRETADSYLVRCPTAQRTGDALLSSCVFIYRTANGALFPAYSPSEQGSNVELR